MNDLFGTDQSPVEPASTPAQCQPTWRIHETPGLPTTAAGYDRRHARQPADPIGLLGLPTTRDGLNGLVLDLCARLHSAGGEAVRGSRLARDLVLSDTRALRLLAAYAHVHHRLRQIVGLPGDGYCWGDARPEVYGTAAQLARRMGRCWFFLAALWGRTSPAVQAAQLVLDFVGELPPSERPRRADELSVLMTSHGVTIEDVLSAIMAVLTETDRGRQALARVGERHAAVLLPRARLDAIREHAERIVAGLSEAAGT